MMILVYILCIVVIIMLIMLALSVKLSNTKKARERREKRIQKTIAETPYSFDIIRPIFNSSVIILLVYNLCTCNPNTWKLGIYNSLRAFSLIMVFALLIPVFIYDIIKKLQTHFLYKNAISKGEYTEGTIINYCIYLNDKARGPHDVYVFVIKYTDIYTNEEKILLTPRLTRSTFIGLGSEKCNVYYYNNKVIAADFKSYLETKTFPTRVPQDNKYLRRYGYYIVLVTIIILELLNSIFLGVLVFSQLFKGTL